MTLAEALRKDVYQTKRELARILRITPRDVEQMVERFVVDHLEEHAEQLDKLG